MFRAVTFMLETEPAEALDGLTRAVPPAGVRIHIHCRSARVRDEVVEFSQASVVVRGKHRPREIARWLRHALAGATTVRLDGVPVDVTQLSTYRCASRRRAMRYGWRYA